MYVERTFELPLPGLSRVVSSRDTSGVEGKVAYLTDVSLAEVTGTRIAFTERSGGVSQSPYVSLDLAMHVGDDPIRVKRNRSIVLDTLGFSEDADALASPLQVHGTTVDVVTGDNCRYFTVREEGSDAIVCTASHVPVLLCFADCVPVIIVAPDGSFAVVHAGWRGALSEIPLIATQALLSTLIPDDVRAQKELASQCNAYIGPHIGSCCFETGSDVKELFVEHFGPDSIGSAGTVDLSRVIVSSLTRAGLDTRRICDAGICTVCQVDRFFSYRAEGNKTGRFGAVACKKER